jgi:hypothetical protein
MSKTKSLVLAALLILAPLTLCLAQETVNVSGEWDFTMTTPRGEMTSTAKFVQDGEKLTVTMVSQRGESAGTFTITYKGKVEGNTMTGEAQMGDFGSAEWKATKKAA